MRPLVLLIAFAACQTTAAAPKVDPAFVYVEDKDELSFWPPTKLRLVRPSRTCDSELSTGKDNMWTGPDVEAALKDPDLQAAVARGGGSFQPAADDAGVIHEATLRIGKATIIWKLRPCRWCVAEPKGIAHLHAVLAGVMMNRRLLCT